MTAYTQRVDADSGTAETSGNPSQMIIDLKSAADQLRFSVEDYLEAAQTGIQKFDPFYSAPLPPNSFNRSYAGYSIDKSGEPDPISIGNAPGFDEQIGNVHFDPVIDPGDYDGYSYIPQFPIPPVVDDITDPGDWDGTVDVNVPTGLVVGQPTDIALKTIQLVNIPQIEIDDFTAIPPDFDNVRNVDDSFDFTEVDYTSDVLTQTDSLIRQMIAGGVGVPELIWNQIWERAGVQVDNSADKLVSEINIEWASRGFSMPQGVQAKQVQEARQEAFNKKSELARDNAIAYSQEEIKNLQFAVQQGIAFETLRGGWHQQAMQRSFENAKYIIESQIALLNADVSLINAKASVYNIEAQVYKTEIDAEVAKMEKYRLDIQSQELSLKDNEAQIKLYGARISALQLSIEEFNANVKAASVESEVVRTQVQVYSEEVKAFSARISAQKAEVDIYTATIDAENVKMSAYETAVKVYSAEIQAYSAKIGASSAKSDAEVKIEQLKLEKYNSMIKGYASEASAKADVYKAEVSGFDSYIKAEVAQAGDSYNQTQSLLDSDKNIIAYQSDNVKINIANAQNATRAAEASAKIVIDTNKSVGEIAAGLSGSIYSAVNVGSTESASASVSGSSGHSTSYDGGIV